MSDVTNNEFAKKYKATLKSRALARLKHSKVHTEAGNINILRLDNAK